MARPRPHVVLLQEWYPLLIRWRLRMEKFNALENYYNLVNPPLGADTDRVLCSDVII
jgi:hypothetical protein